MSLARCGRMAHFRRRVVSVSRKEKGVAGMYTILFLCQAVLQAILLWWLMRIWRATGALAAAVLLVPQLGLVYDNLVVATGHAMMGLSLGPVSGRIVAELVSGEQPSQPLSLLDPDRYA